MTIMTYRCGPRSVDAVGLLRGVEPASNVSMMTIGEPQHGQGWTGSSIAIGTDRRVILVRLRPWFLHVLRQIDQLTHPRQRIGLGAASREQSVVADAMEALRQNVQHDRRMNSPGATVMVLYRAGPSPGSPYT